MSFPRSRTRLKVPSVYQYYYLDYTIGGTDQTSGPYLTAYDTETMSDVVTSNFAKRKAKGETIINPLTYRRVSRVSTGLGQSAASGWNQQGVVTSAWTGSGPLTAICMLNDPIPAVNLVDRSSDARRQAILGALANIDSTPLATGEDLLELGSTISFLKAPLASILKVSKKHKIESFVDMSANAWLTYRFAFSPLVRSVHDILSEIKTPTKKPADIRVAHGRAQFSDVYSDTKTYSVGSGLTRSFYRQGKLEGSVHASIRYRVPSRDDFQWRYGLRGKDILPTFWAVMPLSFMIDRIYDISSMVSAFQNLVDPSVSILGSSITTRSSLSIDNQVTSQNTTNPRESYTGTGEVVTDSTFTMTRTAFQPALGDIIPVFQPSGLVEDITKIADLAALLRVLVGRR